MRKTLLQKVWDNHAVRKLSTGQTQLFIGLHLIHEVTSPQAFDMLRSRGSKVAFPNRTFATVDHIVPTLNQRRPFLDVLAEEMMSALEGTAASSVFRCTTSAAPTRASSTSSAPSLD
jgi:3-isopropylmalate/(R)-2-methylmalate dehydratase large subunit